MKSRVMSNEARQHEKTAKLIWEINKSSVIDTKAVMLAAIKRHFGLGRKRLAEFLKTLKEVEDEYSIYASEEIFEHKMLEEFEGTVDIRAVFSDNETLGEAISRLELSQKPEVTREEAKRIHTAMCEMKAIQIAMNEIRKEGK